MMMGTGYFFNADTALATMSAPSCWLLYFHADVQPGLDAGAHYHRRLAEASAPSPIMRFMGGTTLDKIAR